MSGSKKWYIYTMEYFAAERKKELLPFATAWTDLENICLSAGSEKQIPYDLTYKWNLINKTNKQGGEREIPYDLIYKFNLINKTSKQAKYNQRH